MGPLEGVRASALTAAFLAAGAFLAASAHFLTGGAAFLAAGADFFPTGSDRFARDAVVLVALTAAAGFLAVGLGFLAADLGPDALLEAGLAEERLLDADAGAAFFDEAAVAFFAAVTSTSLKGASLSVVATAPIRWTRTVDRHPMGG